MLAMLVRQEQLLQFDAFDSDIALEIGLRLVRAARAADEAITVDITRHDQRLFHHAMNGTPADHAHWIWRKSNLVKRSGHSSCYVHTQVTMGGGAIHAIPTLDARRFAALGGAFPLTLRGSGVVGAITVAGLPGGEDHALVVRVLRDYLRIDESL
ncbi:heme-degrading domain-containing protein [Massilia atriviolacea]|uniref:Heme-degrading domain-containing protein n=2 Tax=Massilia atriviolacea TaxID=2495579 RepID=A0A430HMN2_9BURK|nr:heme-degrading domain-containing protein [Massilia atriviolacea]